MVADEEVRPSGGRGDPLLYVFQETAVAPGERELAIAFEREGPEASSPGVEAPSVLRLQGRLSLNAGDVALVTYDPETRALVLKGYGAKARPAATVPEGLLPRTP